MKQRFLIKPLTTLVLAAAMILVFGLAQASYAADGGVDGNIRWEYTGGTLKLELVNTSAYDHGVGYVSGTPWDKYIDDIEVIQFAEQANGISRIGRYNFEGYSNLNSVYLCSTINYMDEFAFSNNENLVYVYHKTGDCKIQEFYDDFLGEYDNTAFDGCDSSKLVFDVPENSQMGMFARKYGFMIVNSNGHFFSLMGAEITNEKYYGTSAWGADDGYKAFTREKWTGKAIKPGAKATVELYGRELEYGTDFTCSYSNNINVGVAKVTITGIGDYCESTTTWFVIYPKGTSITKVTGAKKKLTVKWLKQAKKMSQSHITGYQVQVATNKSFTKNKKTKTIRGYKKTSLTVKSLKSKKNYYVRVRTFKDIGLDEDIYSTWSPVKKVKVK